MFWRNLMRYLANNESLVQKLADSQPMRRAAQFTVYMLSKTGSISGVNNIPSSPRDFLEHLQGILRRFQNRIKDASDKKKPK